MAEIKITINGPKRPNKKGAPEEQPLWSATAKVIEFHDGDGHLEDHHAIRNLLISNKAVEKKLLPGTIVALCGFRDVTLFIGGEEFREGFKYENDGDEVKAYQSLLLLQTDSDHSKWKDGKFPPCVCTAGEIDLTRFEQKNEDWKKLFPKDMKPEGITVHSSGFSFRGQARLPWSINEKRIDSLIWASLPFPLAPDAPPTALRLKTDIEAMNADRQKWQGSLDEYEAEFHKLSEIFLQELKFQEAGKDAVWQRWLTLDLVNKTGIPEFHWEYQPAPQTDLNKPQPEPLKLARGEVQLLLSDQPPGERDVSARSMMTANVEAKFETKDDVMTVSFADGQIGFAFKEDEKNPDDSKLGVLKNKLHIDAERNRIVWTAKIEESLNVAETAKLVEIVENNNLPVGFRSAAAGFLNESNWKSSFFYELKNESPTTKNISPVPPIETVKLEKFRAEYDAIETATVLRRQHSLPAPDASVGVVEPALLCGYMPLADGWAQLPVLNLTEQIYFDALRPETENTENQKSVADTPLLLGAATFGNDAQEVFQARKGKSAWNLTLLNGSRYDGSITFKNEAGNWNLKKAELKIYQSDVSLNGFLWLGTAPPTVADALPNTDDWLRCFQQVSLRTSKTDSLSPAPFVLNFYSVNFQNKLERDETPKKEERQYSLPTLTSWDFTYRTNTERVSTKPQKSVFETLLLEGLWKFVLENNDEIAILKENFWRDLPLVWRKHPRMPMIQALPLTQNQMPPNYPSQSRQLVPFELTVSERENELGQPKIWRFEMQTGAGAASDWARLDSSSDFRIAEAWKQTNFLWMASLGVPGLISNPNESAELIKYETADEPLKRFPNLQYLYGLPYTDEINALAGLPKDEDEAAPRAGENTAAEPPALPLARETYEKFWQELSEKAILARQDADEVLAKDAARTFVKNLAEPFVWQVNEAKLNVNSFPGSLVLNGNGGAIPLEGETALRGLEGKFKLPTAGNNLVKDAAGELEIKAGSMKLALTDNGKARDQRGLARGVTDDKTKPFLKTELRRGGKTITLYSLKEAVGLSVSDKIKWDFWFRDVPVDGSVFKRLSSDDTDVNDAAATSSERVHLTGYEWRLNDDQKCKEDGEVKEIEEKNALKLFGFDFFPMTLEKVELENDSIKTIEIVGRLQLPEFKSEIEIPECKDFRRPIEKPELGNAVRVVFTKKGTAFELSDLTPAELPGSIAKRKGEWILKTEQKEQTQNAPSIFWSDIKYTDQKIILPNAEFEFFLFDERWKATGNLNFNVLDGTAKFEPTPKIPNPVEEQSPIKLSEVVLEFANFQPSKIFADLYFKWGGGNALIAEATVELNLALDDPKKKAAVKSANLSNSKTKLALNVELNGATFVDGAFQFSFDGLKTPADIQLLPGMHLSRKENIKGVAAMSLAVEATQNEPGNLLKFGGGFFEAIIPCRWGAFLQDAALGQPIAENDFFNSSAGIIYAGYTLTGKSETEWDSNLLLNGFVEVKNLISFPRPKDDFAAELGTIRFRPKLNKDEPVTEAEIIVEDKDNLKNIAEVLKKNPRLKIRVEGHADISGNYSDNLKISKSRAKFVKDALVNQSGIPAANITSTTGFSSGIPIDTNETNAGKQNNRRVEIVIDHVLIPAANPTVNKPPLHHLRHTLRVLLNQHELPTDLLTKVDSENLLLNFKNESAWQFLAVVEHQLADITDLENGTHQIKSERRWTVAQEVRFAHPKLLSRKLNQFNEDDLKTIDPADFKNPLEFKKLREVNFGYQREQILNLLLKKDGNQVEKLAETLTVEASAIHWILPEELAETGFTNLQYLPDLTQQAMLSSPNDFMMSEIEPLESAADDKIRAPRQQTLWLLLQIPFLGRLQNKMLDVKLPTTAAESALRVDPIWHTVRLRREGKPLDRLSLVLSSWEDKTNFEIRISDFDYAKFRRWRRLDSATLEEGWFRLQNPPVERNSNNTDVLKSVMASLPPDSPGRLSRSISLTNSFNEYRKALPPQELSETDPAAANVEIKDDLVWRRDNLFVLQGFADDNNNINRDYGFHYVAAQVYTSKFFAGQSSDKKLFAAATMIPANVKVSGVENPQPVSFAVSPYLGLNNSFVKADKDKKPLLTYVELIVLAADGKSLSVAAGRIFQENFEAKKLREWGIETVGRLADDSPIAFLRERRIYEVDDGTTDEIERAVCIEYDFIALAHTPLKPLPTKKTRFLRMEVVGLRFAEGQFGGFKLPKDIRSFEIAPPLVPTVEPLYFTNADDRFADFSAIRLSVQYSEGEKIERNGKGEVIRIIDKKGLVGSLDSNGERRIWWSAASHQVQFSAAPEKTRLLPKNFRARSIHSLLPTVPNLPLPEAVKLDGEITAATGNLNKWQPVLPGSYSYLIVGGRAGAQFTFRHSLLTQTKEKSGADGVEGKCKIKTTLASGGVPVQHRMPRPVSIPPTNEGDAARAIQTWASRFDFINKTLKVSANPADNALFLKDETDALGLSASLLGDDLRLITPNDNGKFTFQMVGQPQPTDIEKWDLSFYLVAEGRKAGLKTAAITGDKYEFLFEGEPDDAKRRDKLADFLKGLSDGGDVSFEIKAEAKQAHIKGYKQTLEFPLRYSIEGLPPTALRPVFAQFEDPQYNRRLASQTAQSTRTYQYTRDGIRKTTTLTLAADRREYNSTSELNFAVFGEEDLPADLVAGSLTIQRLNKESGVTETLKKFDSFAVGVLMQVKLNEIASPPLQKGEAVVLFFEPKFDGEAKQAMALRVDVVNLPVMPMPEAAYALLRQQPDGKVECVRFAWLPAAARVELTNPDDLKTGLVRRRAVFRWTDTIRFEPPPKDKADFVSTYKYAVQKILPVGSTHFPPFANVENK